MAASDPNPTQPLRPDSQATQRIGPDRHCRGGHEQTRNPTFHPTLGLVPAITSVLIGVILIGLVLLLENWWLPVLLPWTVGVLVAGLVVSATVQFTLGHRSWCFVWRSLRWWLGPIGSLIDPIEMG